MSWTKKDKSLLEGACADGARWALSLPGPQAVLDAEQHPDWSLWLVARVVKQAHPAQMTPERLDACAEARPWAALEYAAPHLTPSRLDACAEAAPWAALRYAAPRLTKKRLDACAEVWPGAALCYAAPLLTPERRAWCKGETQ